MSKPSGNLLEIPDYRDPADDSRQEYRVRVKGQAGFFLHLCDIPLPLADFSVSGASVLSQAAGELDEKQILENCKLEAAGHVFTKVRCQVMHRSIDTEGSLVCGVQWPEHEPGHQTAPGKVVDCAAQTDVRDRVHISNEGLGMTAGNTNSVMDALLSDASDNPLPEVEALAGIIYRSARAILDELRRDQT